MHKSFRMSVHRAPMPAPLCPTCVHGTHRRPASGLRSSQSALLRLPRKFPVLLAGLVCRPRQYLDPVSVSWKTSIMEAGLIRSALIAISNDGNNVEFVIPTHPSYKKKTKIHNGPSRAGVWGGVVMVMEGWRGRCSGDGLGSDSGLELKSFYGKSRFWHYAQGFRAMCIYTYPAPQTEVLPDTGTHGWRAWERRSDREFSPKGGLHLCYIQHICAWVETGGRRYIYACSGLQTKLDRKVCSVCNVITDSQEVVSL